MVYPHYHSPRIYYYYYSRNERKGVKELKELEEKDGKSKDEEKPVEFGPVTEKEDASRRTSSGKEEK